MRRPSSRNLGSRRRSSYDSERRRRGRSLSRSSIPALHHPIRRHNYIIPTPSIDHFYTRILRCVEFGTPPGGVFGLQRFGKTFAIRFACKMLAKDHPKLVTYQFLCLKTKVRSEANFFSYLLRAVGHKTAHSGNIDRKRDRLIQKIVSDVERSGDRTLLVFVDEAQRLDVYEYEWFRDVYDQLERLGVLVLVCMVGQNDLQNQKDALRQTRNMQIVGRFLTHLVQFRGLLNVSDVATCLEGYDSSCFPDNSGWTFTRYFFPRAYEQGLRLVNYAKDVWNAFQDAHQKAQFRFDIELPMKYFSQTIELALLSNSEHDRFYPSRAREIAGEPATRDQEASHSSARCGFK